MSTDTSSTLQQRILENLHTVVLLFDGTLHLEYANPAAEMMFAASTRRIVGLHVSDVFGVGKLVDSLQEALDSGHPFTKRELPLELPPERRMTVDMTAIPLAEAHAERELLVEMTQVDRQLRIIRDENLLAQSAATRRLVRGLAHEIKNPLGGIRGAAQLLGRELNDEELKEYTTIIISEADRLRNLINRMLGPNAVPHQRQVNVHEVLERVRQVVQVELSSALIVRDYDPSIPELWADPDMLIQAVLNLVRNAAQAVDQEGGEIVLKTRTLRQCTIGQTRHTLVARLDIVDNGPGIPAEAIKTIFLPMVTSRPDGTGLGLPIAQSLVNQHGGLIECDSRPGRTIFTVLLPLDREANDAP